MSESSPPESSPPEVVLPLVREVVDVLAARQPGFSEELTASISADFEPLGDLPASIDTLLNVGVHDNVEIVLSRLRDGLSPEHDIISPGSRAFLHELARHEAPTIWLRRAYHLASEALLDALFGQVERLSADGATKLYVFRHIAAWLHRYVDVTTQLVAEMYENERAAHAERHHSEVLMQVQRVMKGEPVDADAFGALTGHALDHPHLGLVLWIEDIGHGPDRTPLLQAVADEVGAALEYQGSALVLPSGRSEILAWFSGETCDPRRHAAAIDQVMARNSDVRAAVGSPRVGAEGFRRTMDQARSLRHLVRVAPSVTQRVLSHEDDGVPVVAMLAQDIAATRRWVGDTLGSLADDSDSAEKTRETLRLYLRTGSYVETAEQLGLHRNTVKYRVTKVVTERGRDLTSGRLDLDLALQVCHVLGDLVLRRPAGPSD